MCKITIYSTRVYYTIPIHRCHICVQFCNKKNLLNKSSRYLAKLMLCVVIAKQIFIVEKKKKQSLLCIRVYKHDKCLCINSPVKEVQNIKKWSWNVVPRKIYFYCGCRPLPDLTIQYISRDRFYSFTIQVQQQQKVMGKHHPGECFLLLKDSIFCYST